MSTIRRWGWLPLVLVSLSVARGEGFDKTSEVVYTQRGGDELKADVYLPRGEGPFPAVLVVHGGAWRSGSKSQLSRVARHLAGEGFTAVAINYRLAPAHKFPAQVEDVREAVRWMRTNAEKYKIDPRRIGAWGYSAGGHLAAMLAVGSTPEDAEESLAAQEQLQCAICGGAPCDFQSMPSRSRTLSYWLDGTRGENPKRYIYASPIARVSDKTAPIFFYHGESDALVKLQQPKAMQKALEKAGVEAQLHMIPRAGHIAAALSSSATEEATAFLKKHLKPADAE